MPNRNYWINRANQRMDDYILQSEETANEITKAYYMASKRIEQEMVGVVKGLGAISDDKTALKYLRNPQSRSVIRNIKNAVNRMPEGPEKREALTLISSPAYLYRMRRLQETIDNARRECNRLYKAELKDMTAHLRNLYNDAFSHTIYDIDKGYNTLHTFSMFPASRVNKLLTSQWSGLNYSERIWNSTQNLADSLKEQLLVAFMTGASVSKTARIISEQFQTEAWKARRLVRTESNFIANQAEHDAYKRLGVEEYQYIATLDTRTSKLCRELDGRVFNVEDGKPGVNMPPMHPNCRSTTIMYDADFPIKSRAARDENGKLISVPGNTTYADWVDNYHPELRQNVQQNRSVIRGNEVVSTERKNMKIDCREITTSVNHLYVSENVKLKPKALHTIDKRVTQAMKTLGIKDADNLPQIIIVNQSEMQSNAVASYNPIKNIMYVVDNLAEKDLTSIQETFTCPESPISTLIHEYIHWTDAQKYRDAGGTFNNINEYNAYIAELNKYALNQLDKIFDKSYNFKRLRR